MKCVCENFSQELYMALCWFSLSCIFGDKERDSEAENHRRREGSVVDLSIKGDHILATEPLSRD